MTKGYKYIKARVKTVKKEKVISLTDARFASQLSYNEALEQLRDAGHISQEIVNTWRKRACIGQY